MAGRSLITGGAGFIGCNLADRLLAEGEAATILDDLSRRGSERNLAWLQGRHGAGLEVRRADVRDAAAVADAVARADVVYHLAGQTAVTTSVLDPRADFEANALGTLNVLEAARRAPSPPLVVYASTNKVYGTLADVAVVEEATRWRFAALPHGVDESRPLELALALRLLQGRGRAVRAAPTRGSTTCPRSSSARAASTDRTSSASRSRAGWRWLALAALHGRPVTIFGDGKQVRDLLWVDDLVDAYLAAAARPERAAGRVYNLGGGPERTLSVWRELEPLLAGILGRALPAARLAPWRPGDQRVFVADTRAAGTDLGWAPRTGVAEGLERLVGWLAEHAAEA